MQGTNDWTFTLEVPGGVITALALAAALLTLAVLGARALRSMPPARARVLVALRALTALLALAVAVQPAWSGERIERSEGRLAVLFDASRSMGVRTEGERTRRDEARALAARWSAALRASGEEAPEVMTFATDARSSRLDAIAEGLESTGDGTRIGAALRALAHGEAERGGSDLGAVVVVSDGADLGGDALAEAAALGARVHAVAIGAGTELRDDAIAGLVADRVGFLRRQARVRVTVRSLGGGGPVPVTLYQGDEVVREAVVDVPADGEASVDLTFSPSRLGRTLYRVAIAVAPGDAVPENNERAFLVRVVRDNLRVLLVAGQPSWDQRYLRAFLTRDPTTDLISFFILRNTADLTMADASELALIPFPTDELFNEHLGSFDVVLFQNFEYAPYQMAGYLPRIRDYVMRGGSFAMIGGPLSFSAAGYAETPLAEVLPVEVLPAGTPEAQATTTDLFSPVIASDAVHHPILALLPEPRANAEAWARLSPLQGLNVIGSVRSGGRVLLEHPTRRDRTGAPLSVLVTSTAGRGRVLALMTDTSWRWGITTGGREGDASAYERFWDRALRWLARDPALEPARVTTDRESYGPDARMRIEATLADERYAPIASDAVRLVIVDASEREVASIEARTDALGAVTATTTAPRSAGGYRVRVLPEGASAPIAEEAFVVETGGSELADPRARPETLRELAERTGGVFAASGDDAALLSALDATRVRSLGVVTERPFASVWAFLALVLAFGAEWIARRRWGAR